MLDLILYIFVFIYLFIYLCIYLYVYSILLNAPSHILCIFTYLIYKEIWIQQCHSGPKTGSIFQHIISIDNMIIIIVMMFSSGSPACVCTAEAPAVLQRVAGI